jgi:hypothetical protein
MISSPLEYHNITLNNTWVLLNDILNTQKQRNPILRQKKKHKVRDYIYIHTEVKCSILQRHYLYTTLPILRQKTKLLPLSRYSQLPELISLY